MSQSVAYNLIAGIDLTGFSNNTQAGAYQISPIAFKNQVTTCSNVANSMNLPLSPVLAVEYLIRNDGVSACNVFPSTVLGTINGLGAGNAFAVAPGSSAEFLASANVAGAVTWIALNLVPNPGVAMPAGKTAFAGGGQAIPGANGANIPAAQLYTLVSTVANATANALDSVALPTAPALYEPYVVVNTAQNTCAIFPGNNAAANSIINNFAANDPFLLGGNASVTFIATSDAAGLVQWYSYGYTGAKPSIVYTANKTLTKAYNDATILISTAGAATTITLPAVATSAGMLVKFVNSGGGAGNDITIAHPAGTLNGVLYGAATPVLKAAATNMVFANAHSLSGDSAETYCDGVRWNCKGFAQVAASFT